MHRLLAHVLSLAILIAAAGFAQEVRAAVASEIPGTPLLGRSVVGSVGGATIDEVYAVNVPSGSVLIATVQGELGAELGVYLFEPDATSILTAAPITSSARPGGTQSISTAVQLGGTYYVDINGRNLDRAYEYTLSLAIARDTTPPTFTSVSMPARARSGSVCAAVTARDVTSGVRDVRVRESSSGAAAAWLPYTGPGKYCTTASAGSGARGFDVTIRNGVGLAAAPRSFSVIIDDDAPVLSGSTPSQGGVLYEPRGSITWSFNEPVRLAGAVSDNIYVVSQAGARLAGVGQLLGDGTRVRWTPLVGLPAGSILLAAITGVRDQAGNETVPIESLEILRKQRSSLDLARIRSGSRWSWFRYATTRNLIGRDVLMETYTNGAWQISAVITTSGVSGTFRVERSSGAAIRLRWAGDERVDGATSRRVGLGG